MRKSFLYFILILLPVVGSAQNTTLLNNLKDSIKFNALKMISADNNDDQKKAYSDKVSYYVNKFIKQEKSIDYNMDSLKLVKVLTSDNKRIRVFTWAIPLSNNQFLFKGYVQSYVKAKKYYKTIELKDKSAHMSRAYNKTLNPNKWYGAYYYRIIQTKRGSRFFYTLLGWKGIDKTKQSKIIEVLVARSNGDISFGYNLFKIKDYAYFKKMKSVKRLIFTYSAKGSMFLDYDYQTILVKTKKKTKKKKKKNNYGFGAQQKLDQPKEKVKTIRDNLIVMDRLEPTSPEVSEFYDFYFPESNIIDALRFERNAWKYYPDIDARNKPNPNDKKKPNVEYNLTPDQEED